TICVFFFFSSRRRHTRFSRDWSSDVCSSDLDMRSVGMRIGSCCSLPDPRCSVGTVPDVQVASSHVLVSGLLVGNVSSLELQPAATCSWLRRVTRSARASGHQLCRFLSCLAKQQ